MGSSQQAGNAVAVWIETSGDSGRIVHANVFDGTSWQEDGGAPAPTLLEELDGSASRPVIASNGRGSCRGSRSPRRKRLRGHLEPVRP